MKVVFTIVKQFVQKGVIINNETKELVAENVANFSIDDGKQQIHLTYNNEPESFIDLQGGNETTRENWILLDIKCFEVPLKVKL